MEPLALLEAVKARLPGPPLASHAWRGDATLVLRREDLAAAARLLKEAPAFSMDFLMDLTAVDWSAFRNAPPHAFFASSGVRAAQAEPSAEEPWPGPPAGGRFAVVYHFYSSTHRHRLRLSVPVGEGEAVPSLTPLWPGADWLEREVWDMFGLRFEGHPNLKRILMYEEFQGHPLRKDYPVDRRQPLLAPVAPGKAPR